MFRITLSVQLTILVLVASLSVCVAKSPGADSAEGESGNLTAAQAQQQLQTVLDKAFYKKDIKVTADGFQIYYPHKLFGAPIWLDGKTFNYQFRDLGDSKIASVGNLFARLYQVKGIKVFWPRKNEASAFGKALDVLARAAREPVRTPPAAQVTTAPPPSTLPPNHLAVDVSQQSTPPSTYVVETASDASLRSTPPESSASGKPVIASDQTAVSSRDSAPLLLAANDSPPANTVSSSDSTPPAVPPVTAPVQNSSNAIGGLPSTLTAPVVAPVVQAADPNPADTLKQYIAQLQNSPDDQVLREKIVKLVAGMNPPPEIPDEARSHFVKANFYANTKDSDYQKALAEYQQTLLMVPWYMDAYYNDGTVSLLAGQFDRADVDFKLYSLVHPNDPDVLKQYVMAVQKNDNYALREKIIKLAASMNPPPKIPEDARHHAIKGQSEMEAAKDKSDFQTAAVELRQALQLAPWWPEAYKYLSAADESTCDYDKAEVDLKLYLATNPDDARAAQDRIYKIEGEKDLAAKHAADEQAAATAKAQQEAAKQAKIQDLSGDWRNEYGSTFITIRKSGDSYVGSMENDGVWVAVKVQGSSRPGQARGDLQNFWASGTTVHFVYVTWTKIDGQTYGGPPGRIFTLTLSPDGSKLEGNQEAGGVAIPFTLHRAD